MGTLAEKIEALRVKVLDTHGDELYLTTRLKADIAARDAELMTEIVSLIEDHEHRRRNVAQALHLLAQRIGQLPRVAPVSAGPQGLPADAVSSAPSDPRLTTGGLH